MSTSTLMTAEELLRLPKDGFRYELIRGELYRMSPAGLEHCAVAARICGHLIVFVQQHKLGMVLTCDPGFKLEASPDTVRAPDVAFLGHDVIKQITNPRGFGDFAPDLAIEVLSPNDSLARLVKKCEMWLQCGSQAAVIVHPPRRTATLYQPGDLVTEFSDTEVLMVPNVVPGWAMPVKEMFE